MTREHGPPRPGPWRAVLVALDVCIRRWRSCAALAAPYAVLAALPALILGLFGPKIDPLRFSGGEALAVLTFAAAGVGTVSVVVLFVVPATIGALAHVGAGELSGRPVPGRIALRRALDRAAAASGAFLVSLLMAASVPAAIGAVAVGVAATASRHAALPVFAVAVVSCAFPGAYVLVRTSLGVPIAVAERAAPLDAVRRSWERMEGSFVWALAVYVLAGIVAAASGVFGLLDVRSGAGGGAEPWLAMARNGVAGMFAMSVMGIAMGVVYASRGALALELPGAVRPVIDSQPRAIVAEGYRN